MTDELRPLARQIAFDLCRRLEEMVIEELAGLLGSTPESRAETAVGPGLAAPVVVHGPEPTADVKPKPLEPKTPQSPKNPTPPRPKPKFPTGSPDSAPHGVVTMTEAVQILGVSRHILKYKIERGEIKSWKSTGRTQRHFVLLSDVRAAFGMSAEPPAAPPDPEPPASSTPDPQPPAPSLKATANDEKLMNVAKKWRTAIANARVEGDAIPDLKIEIAPRDAAYLAELMRAELPDWTITRSDMGVYQLFRAELMVATANGRHVGSAS